MDNIIRGLEYEKFINNYFNTLENIKISYLWKDVPEYVLFDYNFIDSYEDSRLRRKLDNINKLQDIGTDIIYIDVDDKCVIAQCKNYTTNPVSIQDLAGFFFIMTKHEDKLGEIYYNNKIMHNIKKELKNNNRIKLIRKPFIETQISQIFELYNYQTQVIDLASKYYLTNNTGILSMPCGTGKTIISCYIGMNYKIVVMITPLNEYAKQNISRYNIYENARQSILIDSDGTRDIQYIKDFIRKQVDTNCDIVTGTRYATGGGVAG